VLAALVTRCDVGALRCGTVGPANEPLGIGKAEQLRAQAADRQAARRAMRHHKH